MEDNDTQLLQTLLLVFDRAMLVSRNGRTEELPSGFEHFA